MWLETPSVHIRRNAKTAICGNECRSALNGAGLAWPDEKSVAIGRRYGPRRSWHIACAGVGNLAISALILKS